MEKTLKPWYKNWWAITLFIFFGLIVIVSMSDNHNSANKATGQEVMEDNKPSWYGQELLIDSNEFEFMTLKEVNVWLSFDNRSEIITKVKQKDKITLIGYDAENDYCQIKKDEKEGWIACTWISGLPNDMTNYW